MQLAGLSAQWLSTTDPLGWELSAGERHRDLAAADLAGGEMSISSFVQAKSRGAPIVALPIFLKRGLVQRSLFCRADSPLRSAEHLVGKKVGLVGYTSSMAVWLRAVLWQGYGVEPSSIQWFSLSGASPGAQPLRIPDEFSGEKITAWEELDGYPHALDRRESFLLWLLNRDELDGVVSFQARIDCAGIRPLWDEASLWSDAVNSRIYPINHLLVLKTDILDKVPAIADGLLSAFRESRRCSTNYQTPEERQVFAGELARLGYDPFGYRLDELEKTSLATLVNYLEKEHLISRRLGWDELFHKGIEELPA